MANCSAQCATEQYKKMRHTSLHRNCTLPVFFYWVLFIFFSFYIEQFVNCSFFCVSGIARITAQYTICVLFVPRQCTIDWFLLNQQPHSHTQLTGGEQTFCKSFPKKKDIAQWKFFRTNFHGIYFLLHFVPPSSSSTQHSLTFSLTRTWDWKTKANVIFRGTSEPSEQIAHRLHSFVFKFQANNKRHRLFFCNSFLSMLHLYLHAFDERVIRAKRTLF